jgi:hypothetical protein
VNSHLLIRVHIAEDVVVLGIFYKYIQELIKLFTVLLQCNASHPVSKFVYIK